MLVTELLELIGVCCGIFLSLIIFPWVSIIFFKKPAIEHIEENEKIEESNEEEEYSYIIYLEGNDKRTNPRVSDKLSQELESRGILAQGNLSKLKNKIKTFDENINIKKIRSSYSSNSYEDVIFRTNQRLKIYPYNKELCVFLIRSHFAEKNYYQCIDACDELLELEEKNINALRFIARSYHNLNNLKKASEYYILISEEYDEDLDSRTKLMRYYFEEKKYEHTILICEEILSIDKGNINAEKYIAKSSLILGNKEKTLNKYLEIIEKQPGDIASIFPLVNFYFNENDFDNCIKWCEEILCIDQNNFKAWKIISRCHIKNNNLRNAEESLLKIISLKPEELESHMVLIKYYFSAD